MQAAASGHVKASGIGPPNVRQRQCGVRSIFQVHPVLAPLYRPRYRPRPRKRYDYCEDGGLSAKNDLARRKYLHTRFPGKETHMKSIRNCKHGRLRKFWRIWIGSGPLYPRDRPTMERLIITSRSDPPPQLKKPKPSWKNTGNTPEPIIEEATRPQSECVHISLLDGVTRGRGR